MAGVLAKEPGVILHSADMGGHRWCVSGVFIAGLNVGVISLY